MIRYIMSPDGYGDVSAFMEEFNLMENGDLRKELLTGIISNLG